MAVIVEALDSRLLDSAVHPLDLIIGTGMLGLCQPVFDAVSLASAIKRMAASHGRWTRTVLRQVRELNAVVGQHDLDPVGNDGHQRVEEGACRHGVGLLHELSEGELGGAVDAEYR